MKNNLFTGAILTLCLGYGGTSHASSQTSTESRAASSKLQKCAFATIKAYKVFTVGQMEVWLEQCSIESFESTDEHQRLVFRYEREIPAKGFRESGLHMLEENLTSKRFQEIKPSLIEFNQYYKGVSDGDVYILDWIPKHGLTLRLNGEELGALRPNAVARDYIKIWFGDDPFNDKLKKKLLSQLQ